MSIARPQQQPPKQNTPMQIRTRSGIADLHQRVLFCIPHFRRLCRRKWDPQPSPLRGLPVTLLNAAAAALHGRRLLHMANAMLHGSPGPLHGPRAQLCGLPQMVCPRAASSAARSSGVVDQLVAKRTTVCSGSGLDQKPQRMPCASKEWMTRSGSTTNCWFVGVSR